MPARLDGTGWKMRALPMGWQRVRPGWRLEQQLGWWLEQQLGWWLEHLEWMPTRSDDTGWKMRALPMGKVRQAAKRAARKWACSPAEPTPVLVVLSARTKSIDAAETPETPITNAHDRPCIHGTRDCIISMHASYAGPRQ
jgi:hypothetical protein